MGWDDLTAAAAGLLYGWLLVVLGLALALAVVEAACHVVDQLVARLRGR